MTKVKNFLKSWKKTHPVEETTKIEGTTISELKHDKEESAKESPVPDSEDKQPEHHEKDHKKETKQDDEEIAFDLSFIKNIFKGKQSKDGKASQNKVKHFFTSYQVLLLLLIPLFLSVYFRAQPAYLPATDEWAENNIYANLKNQIAGQVIQEYPNLPDYQKQKVIDKTFNEFLETNRGQVDSQIDQTSKYFKSRMQDDSGQTYLLAIDPYYYLRHARNLVENGHVGDYLGEDGNPYNSHQTAPIDQKSEKNFHMYFEAYLYRFISFFSPDTSLMRVAFFTPVLLASLAIIPAFFIARKVAGNVGGFFTASMLAVQQAFLTRTSGGFADTDAYNVTFPLFIAWTFLLAMESADLRKKIGYSVLTGILIGLYSFAWSGWWYILNFILASLVLHLIYQIVTHWDDIKKHKRYILKENRFLANPILVGFSLLVTSGIFVSVFNGIQRYSLKEGFKIFFNSFLSAPLKIVTLKQVGVTNLWPNVRTTVAELNPASYGQIVSSLGGRLLFFIAIVGILLILFTRDLDNKRRTIYSILLTVWFVGTIFGATRGVRFILLLVPAFSLAFGIGIGLIHSWVSEWFTANLSVKDWMIKPVAFLLFALLLLTPIKVANGVAKSQIPSMNDAWWQSLESVKANTQEDAIISSWWDFGHWFKYIADRPTTFDGASQNLPHAHWIGKSLLTSNENESIGILRMLDCNANSAFQKLQEFDNDDFLKSINILYEVLPLEREQAKEAYLKYLTKNQVDEVIELSHCNPPEAIYITSEDMVSKAGVWAHFGSWDFKRAALVNKNKKSTETDTRDYIKELYPTIDDSQVDSLYNKLQAVGTGGEANSWISPWPSYSGTKTSACKKTGEDLVVCSSGFNINTSTMDVLIKGDGGQGVPYSIVYTTEDGISEKVFNDSNNDISIVLIKEGDSYRSILMQKELTKSMFTRLFFLEGHGLNHYQKISDLNSVVGQRIIVWKVDWSGKSPIIHDGFLETQQVETAPEESINSTIMETGNSTLNNTDTESENSSANISDQDE